LSDEEKEEIAHKVGYGAIKYADLAHHRTSDYRFSLQKMVSLEGNTSAYVHYAYARTQGILRGGQTAEAAVIASQPAVRIDQPEERALALSLLRFPEALQQVAEDYAPNALVDYLYETARRYAVFNDTCHVLKADSPEIKASRLALVALTGKTLRTGLELLGIQVIDRM
jgi:arginyl-tRNA synthetase